MCHLLPLIMGKSLHGIQCHPHLMEKEITIDILYEQRKLPGWVWSCAGALCKQSLGGEKESEKKSWRSVHRCSSAGFLLRKRVIRVKLLSLDNQKRKQQVLTSGLGLPSHLHRSGHESSKKQTAADTSVFGDAKHLSLVTPDFCDKTDELLKCLKLLSL